MTSLPETLGSQIMQQKYPTRHLQADTPQENFSSTAHTFAFNLFSAISYF